MLCTTGLNTTPAISLFQPSLRSAVQTLRYGDFLTRKTKDMSYERGCEYLRQ